MKIKCQKRDLLSALNIAIKAIPAKTTNLLMECFLIEADNNGVHITANNGEMGIEIDVEDGEVLEGGMIAIDSKMFFEIIRKLSNDAVSIDVDSNLTASISCGKAKFHIPGKDGDSFLRIPAIKKQMSVRIESYKFRDVIRQTLFCTSPDDTNRLMTGELMEVSKGRLRLVALDGHRIAIRDVDVQDNCDPVKVVIPGKTLSDISKILPDSSDEVEICFAKNHVQFYVAGAKITSRLIDGNYFKIEQMLNAECGIRVRVNNRELSDCVNRATVVIRDGEKKPLLVTIKEDSMEIAARTALGSVVEEIGIEHEGNDITIGFNPRFMVDALNAISDEDVTLEMTNQKAPCYIRNEEEGYLYVILPVNI